MNSKNIECLECNITFSKKSGLYRHQKKKHGIEKIDIPCNQVCGVCKGKFRTMTDIHKHIQEDHPDVKLEFHEKVFYCQSDFEKWKTEIELQSVSSFILYKTSKRENIKVVDYRCHRSGSPYLISDSGRKRRTKLSGSVKTGVTCPFTIKATEERHHEATEIRVVFQSTHLGHDLDVGKLSLKKKERYDLATILSAGISTSEILNQIDYARKKRKTSRKQDTTNNNSTPVKLGNLIIDSSEISKQEEEKVISKEVSDKPKFDLNNEKRKITGKQDTTNNISSSIKKGNLIFVGSEISKQEEQNAISKIVSKEPKFDFHHEKRITTRKLDSTNNTSTPVKLGNLIIDNSDISKLEEESAISNIVSKKQKCDFNHEKYKITRKQDKHNINMPMKEKILIIDDFEVSKDKEEKLIPEEVSKKPIFHFIPELHKITRKQDIIANISTPTKEGNLITGDSKVSKHEEEKLITKEVGEKPIFYLIPQLHKITRKHDTTVNISMPMKEGNIITGDSEVSKCKEEKVNPKEVGKEQLFYLIPDIRKIVGKQNTTYTISSRKEGNIIIGDSEVSKYEEEKVSYKEVNKKPKFDLNYDKYLIVKRLNNIAKKLKTVNSSEDLSFVNEHLKIVETFLCSTDKTEMKDSNLTKDIPSNKNVSL